MELLFHLLEGLGVALEKTFLIWFGALDEVSCECGGYLVTYEGDSSRIFVYKGNHESTVCPGEFLF